MALALTDYALLSAGAGTIRTVGVGTSQEAQALVFFVVLAVSTVVAPLVLDLGRPVWARAQLGRLQGWRKLHNHVILMVVFGFMGALFTALGVVKLLH
jgi:hypothetical protein